MRFNLKWMLGIVAFVAFGCVALYNASDAWAGAALGITVFVLLAAIVAAVHSNSRAFYFGMAVFGWGYLILTYVPPMVGSAKPLKATREILAAVYPMVEHRVPAKPDAIPSRIPNNVQTAMKKGQVRISSSREGVLYGGPTGYFRQKPPRGYFQSVGHSLFALVFAIIGGCVGQWFARTKATQE